MSDGRGENARSSGRHKLGPRRALVFVAALVTAPGSSFAPTAASPQATGSVQDLVATTSTRSELVAAFARYDQISVADTAGTPGGRVFVAYIASTGTYWALARVEPSASAPLPVSMKFQDGANEAIFMRQAGAGWAVLALVGEPACLGRQGLPSAVEAVWPLRDPNGCPGHELTKADIAGVYGVSFEVPAAWAPTPFNGGAAFDQSGATGLVDLVVATSTNGPARSECEEVANANVNHPYGAAPTVGMAQVADHTACFIVPSGDAAPQRARSAGPAFRLASLVVRYRRPVTLGDVGYLYLVLVCDTAHLWQIATTVGFSGGH